MNINYRQVLTGAEKYKTPMASFLRDLIAIPAESGREEARIARIKLEMEQVGFDRVEIDPMGNILGYLGSGKRLIAMDAHIDSVGVGDRSLWSYDPFKGFEDDEVIVGRGASDQLGGMAAMVYGARLIKDFDLR